MARAQSQQQQQQQQQMGQQQQPQFSLGVPQMQGVNAGGAGVGGPSQQQQAFHDQSNAQSQGQTHMSPAFSNLGMNPSIHNSRTMIQAFQNPGHNVTRQLELIGLAQNQQPQNGPINFGARLNPQQRIQPTLNGQQGLGQSAQDIFSPGLTSNDAIRRPSPSHPNAQPAVSMGNPPLIPPNHGMAGNRRQMTLTEMGERGVALQNVINQQEQAMSQYNAQRATIPEATFMGRMRLYMADLKTKKDYLAKLHAAM